MNDHPIKTIGLLTSGGDAPGMNPCIRAVVRTGLVRGLNMLGIEDRFEGLIKGRFRPLGARDVGGILQRGGTILQTARCEAFMELQGQREIGLGIDLLPGTRHQVAHQLKGTALLKNALFGRVDDREERIHAAGFEAREGGAEAEWIEGAAGIVNA